MDIKIIKPKQKNKSDKYSWQLYRYFEKNELSLGNIRVIYSKENIFNGESIELDKNKLNTNQIWIGNYEADGLWFHGNAIGTIIGCSREKYTVFANPWLKNKEIIDITDWFINEYIKIGRCIWDKSHTGWLKDDDNRFTYIDDNNRKCNWCGEVHHREIIKKIKIERKEVWK